MERWDETWHRLLEWTNDQGPSERLAAQILSHEGFEALEPSHPLGGRDGGRDAVCSRNGKKWVMAVYFPRGQQGFTDVKKKFVADLTNARQHEAGGFAFVTNQEIHLAERSELKGAAAGIEAEIYHLERLTTILDTPAMAPVRKQFLGIDYEDAPTHVLGGQGGMAPGAGGGGGAAIGSGATGGPGGKGGRISLGGHAGRGFGTGGGGGGAIGDNVVGGEGGEGGEIVSRVFRAEDLPPVVEVKIGAAGKGGEKGGDGGDGGDSSFGDLLHARGGRGGKAGGVRTSTRVAIQEDVKKGLRVSAIYLAECVHAHNGLLYLLGAGWEHYQVPSLPFHVQWPLVVTASTGQIEVGTQLELQVVVTDPQGQAVARQSMVLARVDTRLITRPNLVTSLGFVVSSIGVWNISIVSGDIELADLTIEIRCNP